MRRRPAAYPGERGKAGDRRRSRSGRGWSGGRRSGVARRFWWSHRVWLAARRPSCRSGGAIARKKKNRETARFGFNGGGT